ncbi:MAG: hypothetical protein JW941_09630 [Candidatus Coatesbacteria bacterium]|nr:hypothetical protein [Candidatus Coatesbacteria bacterium]
MSTNIADFSEAFSQLGEHSKRHLPFIGLFRTHVHAGMLGMFPLIDDDKERLYSELMGEIIDTDKWKSILEEARAVGLLSHLEGMTYRFEKSSAPISEKWAELAGADRAAQFDREFVRFYAMWAGAMRAKLGENQPPTFRAVEIEADNLKRAIRISIEQEMLPEAEELLRLLRSFYSINSAADQWEMIRANVHGLIKGRKAIEENKFLDKVLARF